VLPFDAPSDALDSIPAALSAKRSSKVASELDDDDDFPLDLEDEIRLRLDAVFFSRSSA
jgi:hypothetical protein